MRTVKEIVRQHLEREGYDGLFNEAGECACLRDDLAPCNCMTEQCEAGYRVDCADTECEFANEGGHWHMVDEKPVPPSGFIVGERYVFVREEPARFEAGHGFPWGSQHRDNEVPTHYFEIRKGDIGVLIRVADDALQMRFDDTEYLLPISLYANCFKTKEKN